jgi:4-hydroxy-4-methyl-2-oxoglutarate aldolase
MVELSDNDDLTGKFVRLPCARMFVYGDENRSLSYLDTLKEEGVELAEIAHSGHFPMYANPPALADVGAMKSSISPLFRGAKFVGPAKTARILPGENAAIHRAVHTAKRGDILVVDGGGNTSFGPFGDILTTCCQNQGIAGAVIDSTIRDTEEIRALRFPVFCLGAHPAATGKSDPGEIDITIVCGGVRVRPGDFIVGDDDGVVVVPQELAQEVADRAAVVAGKEELIMARLAGGETTFEIVGLDS